MNERESSRVFAQDYLSQLLYNPHSAVQNDIFLNNKDSQVLLLILLLLIFLQNREKSRSSHFRSKVLISCLLPTMQKV